MNILKNQEFLKKIATYINFVKQIYWKLHQINDQSNNNSIYMLIVESWFFTYDIMFGNLE